MAEASSEELAEASAALAALKAEKADLDKEAADLPAAPPGPRDAAGQGA